MKGGFQPYHGSGVQARRYLEADNHDPRRSAAEYYLGEGSGLADLIHVDASGAARSVLNGPDYQSWVEGFEVRPGPDRGGAKGKLRNDAKALRFMDCGVNTNKSHSIAAGWKPEVSVALDHAQDQVVGEVARFLKDNVVTRIGGRGRQRHVHADSIELTSVTHYSARGGDPHRHRHLHLNARIQAGGDGSYHGLDSASLMTMQRAFNAIGDRVMRTDPVFRMALAQAGMSLRKDGEVAQLARFVPAASKRSAQIEANIANLERTYLQSHPGHVASWSLMAKWRRLAWASDRAAKSVKVQPGEQPWMTHLRSLGFNPDATWEPLPPPQFVPIEDVDLDGVAARALAVLGSGAKGRSTWNAYDIRGAVEEVLVSGRFGDIIADPSPDGQERITRAAVATARRVRQMCVSTLGTPVMQDHIRYLTSSAIIACERDIRERLAVRSAMAPPCPPFVGDIPEIHDGKWLDKGQTEAIRAIVNDSPLVLIEGAAGSAKSTAIAAAAQVIDARGGRRRMLVTAPSRKAVQSVEELLDSDATTVHGLIYQHGYRWDEAGVYSRLTSGDVDPQTGRVYQGPRPEADLLAGDVLVVDEAGMLDQDTYRAILHIADETDAKIALIGDREQLGAVGRGGVVEMSAPWVRDADRVEMTAVHRFRLADGKPDKAFAELSLRMRSGVSPGETFDELLQSGHVRLHETEIDRAAAVAVRLADRYAKGTSQSYAVTSNADAEAINEVVRERLIALPSDATGKVDGEGPSFHGSDGLEISKGDLVLTRKNDIDQDVWNGQAWKVQEVFEDRSVRLRLVEGPKRWHHERTVDSEYARENVHLAYATTVNSVQGVTVTAGGGMLSPTSDAKSVYVTMTRGTRENVLDVVGTPEEAREQFVAASERDRADLGLEAATAEAQVQVMEFAPWESSEQLAYQEDVDLHDPGGGLDHALRAAYPATASPVRITR